MSFYPDPLYMAPTARFDARKPQDTTEPTNSAFPSLQTFEDDNLKLPLYLYPVLTLECHRAFEACRLAALHAYSGSQDLAHLHSLRYQAMCPQPQPGPRDNSVAHSHPHPALLLRSYLHRLSINHLLNWLGLYDSALTISRAPKIPAEILSFTIDQAAYEGYLFTFQTAMNSYINDVYGAYVRAKSAVEDAIERAGMGCMDRRMWRHFWEGGFLGENAKWVGDLGGLEVPGWEGIVGELYAAVLERVEGVEGARDLIRGVEGKEVVVEEGDGGLGIGGFEVCFMLEELEELDETEEAEDVEEIDEEMEP